MTSAAFGWMKVRKGPCLKSTAQRKKLNIQGVVDIDSLDVISSFDPWLAQENTLDFLDKANSKKLFGRIYLIMDRVPYHHTDKVKANAKALGIRL